uniref:ATP synthase F0 subunit a n=1 Tax=Diplonema japonicum TaxID=2508216 RepID=A0A6G5ZV42_9EUGL|nr:ATP synthase F0 subunit a [Diplonema japonicum]
MVLMQLVFLVVMILPWALLRVLVDLGVASMHTSPLSRLSMLSCSLSILMVAAVCNDTDLVVSYLLVILLINAAHAFVALCMASYTRSASALAHMYLGYGLPAILRIVLGCIEMASTSFRSVSLTLRAACNAIAGHVLVGVLLEMTIVAVLQSASLCTTYFSTWLTPLLLLKLVTSIIQGIVLSRLLTTYWDELLL